MAVLAGGYGSLSRPVRDLWEWDGIQWRFAVSIPFGQSAAAYDSIRQATLFVGKRPGVSENWTWDGTNLVMLSTNAAWPSGPVPEPMVGDSGRGRVVLINSPNTWEWDGSAWSSVSAGLVAQRIGHALAYDSSRGRTLLMGGTRFTGFPFRFSLDVAPVRHDICSIK
jgi:hypothetical protein